MACGACATPQSLYRQAAGPLLETLAVQLMALTPLPFLASSLVASPVDQQANHKRRQRRTYPKLKLEGLASVPTVCWQKSPHGKILGERQSRHLFGIQSSRRSLRYESPRPRRGSREVRLRLIGTPRLAPTPARITSLFETLTMQRDRESQSSLIPMPTVSAKRPRPSAVHVGTFRGMPRRYLRNVDRHHAASCATTSVTKIRSAFLRCRHQARRQRCRRTLRVAVDDLHGASIGWRLGVVASPNQAHREDCRLLSLDRSVLVVLPMGGLWPYWYELIGIEVAIAYVNWWPNVPLRRYWIRRTIPMSIRFRCSGGQGR